MRWPVFALFVFLALILETSLLDVLRVGPQARITPSFAPCLAVFICLMAPRKTALWAVFILGLLYDLAFPAGDVLVVGPHALGYTLGGAIVLQLRMAVFRRRALTVGVLTLLFMVAVSVVVITIYVVRSWHPALAVEDWTTLPPLRELLRRLGVSLYSGVLAIPAGYLLVRTIPIWGFQLSAHRSTAWR